MMRPAAWTAEMGRDDGFPSPELLEAYSQFFRLLSEPARLQLLCHLRSGERDVASLIAATGFSQSHVSRQLGQLERAGLIRSSREGNRSLWRTEGDLVQQLCGLVAARLRQRLEERMRELQQA
jgi:DNA-binding transcriptional ArsR family regulator